MSATNAFEDKILALYGTNVGAANIGDAAGLPVTIGEGDLHISLHTADPGEVGDQTTSEAAYTSYARVATARNATDWTVTTGTLDNDLAITFVEATGGSETELFFGVGFALAGAGSRDLNGALTSGLLVSINVQPEFAAGALDITLD
jgi:hypothetical protein